MHIISRSDQPNVSIPENFCLLVVIAVALHRSRVFNWYEGNRGWTASRSGFTSIELFWYKVIYISTSKMSKNCSSLCADLEIR